MEEWSEVYDMVEKQYINKWREEVVKSESAEEREKVMREKLKENLDDEAKKLVDKYAHVIDGIVFDVELRMRARILNIGVKIGYELGKIFAEVDYKKR